MFSVRAFKFFMWWYTLYSTSPVGRASFSVSFEKTRFCVGGIKYNIVRRGARDSFFCYLSFTSTCAGLP